MGDTTPPEVVAFAESESFLEELLQDHGPAVAYLARLKRACPGTTADVLLEAVLRHWDRATAADKADYIRDSAVRGRTTLEDNTIFRPGGDFKGAACTPEPPADAAPRKEPDAGAAAPAPPTGDPNRVPIGELRRIGERALAAAASDGRIAAVVGWVAVSLQGIDDDTLVNVLLQCWDDASADRKVAYVVEATGLSTIHLEAGQLPDLPRWSAPGKTDGGGHG